MSAKLTTKIKAEGVALALYRLTGVRPSVEYVGQTARVFWRAEDLPVARAWFESQVSRAELPPDVVIDLLPVVGPYAARSAAPAVVLTLAVGVLLGRYL